MRLLLYICFTAVLSYCALLILPWWTPILLTFILSWLLPMSAGRSFFAGAIGVGLCWLLVPWYADMANQHLLSSKMANLFQLPSYVLVLAVSCLIGFLTGGLGSWTAACLRKVVFPKPTTPEGTRN